MKRTIRNERKHNSVPMIDGYRMIKTIHKEKSQTYWDLHIVSDVEKGLVGYLIRIESASKKKVILNRFFSLSFEKVCEFSQGFEVDQALLRKVYTQDKEKFQPGSTYLSGRKILEIYPHLNTRKHYAR